MNVLNCGLGRELLMLREALDLAGEVCLKQLPAPFARRQYAGVKELGLLRSMAVRADRDSELAMIGVLRDFSPQTVFFGEETGGQEKFWAELVAAEPDADAVRITLDGIDGTGHFCHNNPALWGVQVGIERGGKPLAGGIFLPKIDQLLLAKVPDQCYFGHMGSDFYQEVCLNAEDRPTELHKMQYACWRGKCPAANLLMKYPYCQLAEVSDADQINYVSTVGGVMALLSGSIDMLLVPWQAYWDALPAEVIVNAAGGACQLFPVNEVRELEAVLDWSRPITKEERLAIKHNTWCGMLAAATPELFQQTLALLQG